MKHNYFHYCISVRLGKGGERNAKCRREKSREMAEQRARKTKKDRRGENTWMERKTEKPFTQEKALSASWLNWQKNVQPFRNSEACLLGAQTSSVCISINLYSADKKANFNIHWIWGSYISLPPLNVVTCLRLLVLESPRVWTPFRIQKYTQCWTFSCINNFYTIYRNSVRLSFFYI